MYKVKDIINAIEKYAPQELALDWDNVGLMVGNAEASVSNVLLCLDVTSDVICEAARLGCEMIISHHPFIFHSMKNIDLGSQKGRDIETVIKNGITVYSAHTNLDFAEKGVDYYFMKNISEIIDRGNITLNNLAKELKDKLNTPCVKIIYGKNMTGDSIVTNVLSGCGSFSGDIEAAIDSGSKVLVTGEVKYNDALELVENGITVIEAGHYGSETIILPYLNDYLSEQFEGVKFYLTNTEFRVNIIY